MALYSSTLHLTSTLNMSFINNQAYKTGWEIHIEPYVTRELFPKCFYEVEGQPTSIMLYYSDNHAEFGGDNIYGTSLAFCENNLHITNYFASNVSMSSVSSNPRQVCLCDNDGRPLCENSTLNSPFLSFSKSVYPDKNFTITAVIMGGDYGTTIGIVHAVFV